MTTLLSLSHGEIAYGAESEKVPLTMKHSGGSKCTILSDGSTKSSVSFSAGQSLYLSSEQPLKGLFIKWSATKIPGEWILKVGDSEIAYGRYNFLHEYVELPEGTTECTLYFPNKLAGIVEIEAYGKGELPKDVQVWDPPCEKADLLVLSTHADDEVLFLGGVCVLYGGQQRLKTQVVYLCDFTLNDYGYRNTTREHEKLDGLWEMGIRNYPVNGNFPDAYSTTLKKAMTQYDYDAVVEFVAENIRRFKPLVLVSQDFKGEYGHGGHMLFAKAAADALEKAADPAEFQKSYANYGIWDVPKAYYHLYTENKLRLDLRSPLSNFGGQNSLTVQKAAYKKHVTQQECWFYVSDEYKDFDCAAFGLYRSLVGLDTEHDDMFENLTTYEKQLETDAEETLRVGEHMFFRFIGGSLSDHLDRIKK
ncbi:MAG: PIG-L family deacetylase [Lachnospiraceae bacterium]|nr:PIG-L family deacetylase [Lachnospiraceae bacterium]